MVTDRLGKPMKPGDIIAYRGRSGDIGVLNLRIILDTKEEQRPSPDFKGRMDTVSTIYIVKADLENPRIEIPIRNDADLEALKQHPKLSDVRRKYDNPYIAWARDLSREEFSAKRAQVYFPERAAIVDLPPQTPDEPLEIKALRMGREKVLNGEIRRKR